MHASSSESVLAFSVQSLKHNASLLRARASRHAVIGTLIAIVAVILATILSGYSTSGEFSLEAFLQAQQSNKVLWILDMMPFIFAFWGQYVNSVLSYEASAMVLDQTNELRSHTALLEQKAVYEATHDSLTNLPNRSLFIDRLQQATNSAVREGLSFAVLILDIDNFKDVNDTLGHYNGDRLIKQIALRLSNVIRGADTLARIGGDEFAFLLPMVASVADMKQVAKKIRKSLAQSFVLENITLDIQASIGAVLFPEHGKDVDTLIQRADVAMYVAKHEKSGFVVYSKKLDGHSPHRLTLMGELREALKQDKLVVHYQPKILTATNQLAAVEALVRWQHDTHGMLGPDEFIPLAERTGLIQDLTFWVLKQALQQCARWHRAALKIGVAVNMSSQCLLDPEFPEVLTGLLASYEFPPQALTLEITETSFMVDPERSLEILRRIHETGVGFSIDDFGTGYSSLSYLKQLPVSELKIDKSFVTDMLHNDSDLTIVNATIALGHNLGLKVVAEGVEDRKTFEKLREMQCDVVQGYIVSRPLTPDEFIVWIKKKIRRK